MNYKHIGWLYFVGAVLLSLTFLHTCLGSPDEPPTPVPSPSPTQVTIAPSEAPPAPTYAPMPTATNTGTEIPVTNGRG